MLSPLLSSRTTRSPSELVSSSSFSTSSEHWHQNHKHNRTHTRTHTHTHKPTCGLAVDVSNCHDYIEFSCSSPSPSLRISVAKTPRLQGDHDNEEEEDTEEDGDTLEYITTTAATPSTSTTRNHGFRLSLTHIPLDILTSIYDFLTLHDMMSALTINHISIQTYHVDEMWAWRCRRDWQWKVDNERQMHLVVSHSHSSSSSCSCSCHWSEYYQYLYNDFISPVTSLIDRSYSLDVMISSKSRTHVDVILQPENPILFILSNGTERMRRQFFTKQQITQSQVLLTSAVCDIPISIMLFMVAISLQIAFPMWCDVSNYIYFDTNIMSLQTLAWFLPFLFVFTISQMLTTPRQPVSRLEPQRMLWHLLQHITTTSVNQIMYGYALVVLVMSWFWLFNLLFEWMGALACILSLCYFTYRMSRSYRAGNLHVSRSIMVLLCHGGLLTMFWFIDIIMIITKYILSPIFHVTMAWQLKPVMDHDWHKYGVLASSLLVLGVIYVVDCGLQHSMLMNPNIRSISLRSVIWRAIMDRVRADPQLEAEAQAQAPPDHQPEQQQEPRPGFGFLESHVTATGFPALVLDSSSVVDSFVPPAPTPPPQRSTPPLTHPVSVAQLGAHLEELGGMLLDILIPRNMSWHVAIPLVHSIVWYGFITGIAYRNGMVTAACVAAIYAIIPCVVQHGADVMVSRTRGMEYEARNPVLTSFRRYITNVRPFIPISQQ